MHWHPPQNSTESKQGAADLPTYTVVPNGLNPSKISSLTHAISQIFPNKFQSSHIISVFGRCIRSIFCQNLSNSCRNKYDRSISKSNFCLGFLSIGPNYAYLPSVVKNSNIRRPVLRMLLACTSYDLRWVHQNVHSGPKECVKYDTRKTRLAINFLIWKRRLLGATNPSSSTPL